MKSFLQILSSRKEKNKMDKKLKQLLAANKVPDAALIKFLESYKPEDKNDNESENQDDSEDEDLDGAEEKPADKEDSKAKPKLTMEDLEKMIEEKIKKLGNPSKKKPNQPIKKDDVRNMEGGIEFMDFGLIPTKK